jgi:RNA-directed DNA polymerase
VNTDASWPSLDEAQARVLDIQTKLHRWATDNSRRRFDDLYNLVCDPAFLVVAWKRVRGNRGARSAGVDGETAYYVETVRGEDSFLAELRDQLKARQFTPLPVRERFIPKADGKRRRLGIPAVRDRVVQAALKLVLEPIFETTFQPCSYGYRPARRAQDAIAEIHHLASRSYEWVLEADIEACFDNIDHTALLGRVRDRIGDKRVLALLKAFLKAGVLTENGAEQDTISGTPQGGIISPLLSNIALSVLDDYVVKNGGATMASWQREARRCKGLPNYRIVRYADDHVVLVAGTKAHAEQLRDETAAVLAPMGLRLSEHKTHVVHIDEGFEFLGWRIQRHVQRGSQRRYVYTYPSRSALASIKARVRAITKGATNQSLSVLLHRINRMLRGWANYFRHGASAKTFAYLDAFTWRRVIIWLRRKHRRISWKDMRKRHLNVWRPTQDGVTLFDPGTIAIARYRYRGNNIPLPWPKRQESAAQQRHELVESPVR